MHCRLAREWTRARLDAPLQAEEERQWQAHIADCAACAADQRDAATLQQWVASMPLEEPSANFDWRLRLRLSKAEREAVAWPLASARRRWRASFEFGTAAAVAAGIVLVAGTWVLQRSAPESPVWNVPMPKDAGGQVIPVSNGAPYGPQPAPSYSYFIQAPPSAADTTAAPHPVSPPER